jgi:hypothetical protein
MKMFKNTPKKWLAGFTMLGLLTLLLSSCLRDDYHNYNNSPNPQVAYVTFAQTSPGEPPLNFALNNDLVNSWPLNFGDDVGYFRAYTGQRTVNIYNASTAAQILTVPVTLSQNQSYSLFLANTSTSPSILMLTDTLAQPASGMAGVRFVNLGPDAPAVDLIIQGGATIASNKAFKGYSSFVPVAAGSNYNLEVVNTGTTTVLASLPGTVLRAGFVYTIWLQGLINTTVTGQKLGINQMVNTAFN